MSKQFKNGIEALAFLKDRGYTSKQIADELKRLRQEERQQAQDRVLPAIRQAMIEASAGAFGLDITLLKADIETRRKVDPKQLGCWLTMVWAVRVGKDGSLGRFSAEVRQWRNPSAEHLDDIDLDFSCGGDGGHRVTLKAGLVDEYAEGRIRSRIEETMDELAGWLASVKLREAGGFRLQFEEEDK